MIFFFNLDLIYLNDWFIFHFLNLITYEKKILFINKSQIASAEVILYLLLISQYLIKKLNPPAKIINKKV